MDPNTIIIHHSASPDVSAKKIKEWHLDRGWKDIGYHFVIRKNGNIELGRPWNKQGAHAKDRNENSLGICVTGNFEENYPKKEQILSLVNLVNGLKNKFNIDNIERHHGECPGKNFPWKYFINNLKEE